MNIFVLDLDPVLNAQYHVDKHIVKMPLELSQILCTVNHSCGAENVPYRATHRHHPSVLWAGSSTANYIWTLNLGFELCKEYTFRYNKIHKCQDVLNWCVNNIPVMENKNLTPFYLAMPDEYKCECPVQSYRNYYNGAKTHLFNWTKREVPRWIGEHNG